MFLTLLGGVVHCGYDDPPAIASDASGLNGGGAIPDGGALPGYNPANPDPEELFSFVTVGVFEARCQFPDCHHGGEAPASDLDLTTDPRAALLGPSAVLDRQLVIPGDPDGSYLVEKLTADRPEAGQRMPPGSPLDSDQLDLIRQWIEAGAPP